MKKGVRDVRRTSLRLDSDRGAYSATDEDARSPTERCTAVSTGGVAEGRVHRVHLSRVHVCLQPSTSQAQHSRYHVAAEENSSYIRAGAGCHAAYFLTGCELLWGSLARASSVCLSVRLCVLLDEGVRTWGAIRECC